ncbi:decarboxylase [Lacrimispora amygdalina]|uniref:Decarboxylase n=1 Tax=Lacrimispora amygdalina TaxID=253257 RepID=A0A3E2N9A2_9FIRM|nr:decarboxylase [Clostridium indicum]RFZ77589.1 decarboxylase [Clostridium indicum]
MEQEKLRSTLITHLDTLRRNLEVVSIEVLKTKYQKPYETLAKDICAAASAYTQYLALTGIRLKAKYFDEAKPYIDGIIQNTTVLKTISEAAFKRQDIEEIERLALSLRQDILNALHPFYLRHLCLYVTAECIDTVGMMPEIYNDANGCIWRDNTWQPFDDTSAGLLLYAQEKPKETDTAPVAYPMEPTGEQEERKAS